MKKILLIILSLLTFSAQSQPKKWTNATGNNTWSTPNNWLPTGSPGSTDDVIFDNAYVSGSYIIDLPSGATTTIINTLAITPDAGNTIRLRLPSSNNGQPGFAINSTTGDIMQINDGGIFENTSGAPSSPSISIPGTVRINNGGRYLHNTISTASAIVTHLSLVPGTELGVIEYGQGSNNSLLSSGVTYNSIELSSTSTKSFSFSGNSPTLIRGLMKINTGVTFTSLKNGSIDIAGDLIINGLFDFSPSSTGTVDRSLVFNGSSNQNISGSGAFTQGNNFRNLEINRGAIVTLLRNLDISNTADSILIDTAATFRMGQYVIDGASNFRASPLSTLSIGSPNGINNIGNNSGNIQTTGSRNFDTSGIYEYYGTGNQITGTGLPVSVKNLIINKPDFSNLTLTKNVNINDTISLQNGFLSTSLLAIPTMRDTTAIISPPSVFSILLSINNVGYKKSFVNGPLAININSKSGKWFPIGKVLGSDTLFAPVKLSKFNGNPVIDTVEYFYQQHFDANNYSSPPLDHVSKVEYWNIHCNSGNPDNADTITLSWRSQSKIGNGNPAYSVTALNDLTIAHYFDDDGSGPNPARWNIEGEPSTFVINGNVDDGMIRTTIPESSTSSFTLGTRSPFNILPVLLTSFNGIPGIAGNDLYWITELEIGVKKYIIEKSGDGIDFKEIGIIPSLSSTSQYRYHYFDISALEGGEYRRDMLRLYRLKIIDDRNMCFYSNIIKLWAGNNRRLEIYPNPAQKEIFVHLSDPSSISTLEIVNTGGQTVFTRKVTSTIEKINIESLSTGMYQLRFRNQLLAISRSFIKQ